MSYLELRNLPKIFVSEALRYTNDNLLLVAFGITNPLSVDLMEKDWRKSDTPLKAKGRNIKSTHKLRSIDFGGALTLIKIKDNGECKVLAEMDIETPMGLCMHKNTNELLVGSAFGILTVKHGKTQRNLKHNLFSQVHGLSLTKKGVVAACTNTDSIVEFSISEKSDSVREVQSWLATKNGLNINTYGKVRTIDPNINYQFLDEGGTRSHTTHINSVIEYDDNHYLATLFHQDQLVMINKRTGKRSIVFDGMTNLHHIRKQPSSGYMFSATRRNSVMILDEKLNMKKEIKKNFDWIQDSIFLKDKICIADNNNSRFVFMDKDKYEISFEIFWKGQKRRTSCLMEITAEDARTVFLKE